MLKFLSNISNNGIFQIREKGKYASTVDFMNIKIALSCVETAKFCYNFVCNCFCVAWHHFIEIDGVLVKIFSEILDKG